MMLAEAVNVERLFGQADLPEKITDHEMKAKALAYHGASVEIDLDKVELSRKHGAVYILRWDPTQLKQPARQILGTPIKPNKAQGK